jgi:hypothetical protein
MCNDLSGGTVCSSIYPAFSLLQWKFGGKLVISIASRSREVLVIAVVYCTHCQVKANIVLYPLCVKLSKCLQVVLCKSVVQW